MKCTECKLFKNCRKMQAAAENHFRWSFHNLIAHPLSEIIHLFGFTEAGNKLHDWSIPEHEPEQGRG